jgi:hypothetical protein
MKKLKARVKREDNDIVEVRQTVEHNGLKYVVGCGGVFGGDVKNYNAKIQSDIRRIEDVVQPQHRIVSEEEVTL